MIRSELTGPTFEHPKRYTPKVDRRRALTKKHLAAVRVAEATGAGYTWLWLDGGITHCVGREVAG